MNAPRAILSATLILASAATAAARDAPGREPADEIRIGINIQIVPARARRPPPDFPETREDREPSPRRPAVAPGAWLFLAVALMTVVLARAILEAVRQADKRPMDDFE